MADVTKELLIKIGTTGAGEASNDILGLNNTFGNTMMGIMGLNSVLDIFNKGLNLVKTGIGYVIDASNSLINVGSTFEQLGVRFETIFGGKGPAQKALDWATDFAAKTPLTLEDVTQRMLKLKTYGFDPMAGSLEAIGNASYALGADFDGIVTALGQMALKGKVSQEEINQLAERGVPAARWLKEEFHLTTKQMSSLGDAGLNTTKVLNFLFSKFASEYKGAMMKASDTWAGSLSTISDTWTVFQKNIMDSGPFTFLVNQLKIVRDEFSRFVDGPGVLVARNLGGYITEGLKGTTTFIKSELFPFLTSMGERFTSMGSTFISMWNTALDFLSPIYAGLRGLSSYMQTWSGTMYSFASDLFKYLGVQTGGLKDLFITALDLALRSANSLYSFLKSGVLELGNMFAVLATDFAGSPLADLLGLSAGTKAAIQAFGENFGLSVNEAKGRQKQEFEDTNESITDFINAVRLGAANFTNALDSFKISPTDPFGASSMSKGQRYGVLYDKDKGIGVPPGNISDAFSNRIPSNLLGNGSSGAPSTYNNYTTATPVNSRSLDDQKYADFRRKLNDPTLRGATKMLVQLAAPPGDPMLKLIVEYINKAVKAEGKISGAF